jgi:glycosidase
VSSLSPPGLKTDSFLAPTKAASPKSVGYDVYDLWDLGEFNQKGSKPTKYGTKDELKKMIKVARDNGIVTYIDAVLNHKFGADTCEKFEVSNPSGQITSGTHINQATEVDSDDRTKDISDNYDIEGWTGFNFPGRKNKVEPDHSKRSYVEYACSTASSTGASITSRAWITTTRGKRLKSSGLRCVDSI